MLNSDIIIIGAGVIGLSIGYYLSKNSNKNIIILEKKSNIGEINSSRNTETIHAGIYYKENSLKSKLCLRGKILLYEFCKQYKINYKKCGKIFIAQNDLEYQNFDTLLSLSKKNNLNDLKILNSHDLSKLEPNISAKYGLLSPSSGIFDSYNFLQTLENLNISNSVIVSKNSEFIKADKKNNSWDIQVKQHNEFFNINSKYILNCAGLNSIEISKKINKNIKLPLPNPVKGSYLRYDKPSPINHIIYPSILPGEIKERTDAVPSINGGLRFGPSIDETNSIDDFSIDKNLIDRFYKNIKIYIPKIDINDLKLDLAGIRPRIIIEDNKNPDFYVKEEESGLINLIGIESPGLTASLAFGEYICNEFDF